MSQPDVATAEAPTGTRAALIAAGFRVFGRDGFAGASTRAIAAEAGTNVASIAYHFGGKDGLRAACAAEIARHVGGVMNPLLHAPLPADPAAARAAIKTTLRNIIGFLFATPEGPEIVPFLLREVTEGAPTLDLLYARMLAPVHGRLCALWALASGTADADADSVRLGVFALIGQAVYFRIGAPLIARRMDWPAIGPDQARRIADVLCNNVDALLGPMSGPKP